MTPVVPLSPTPRFRTLLGAFLGSEQAAAAWRARQEVLRRQPCRYPPLHEVYGGEPPAPAPAQTAAAIVAALVPVLLMKREVQHAR